jgi:hypothetical protein
MENEVVDSSERGFYADFCINPHTRDDAISILRALRKLGFRTAVVERGFLDSSIVEEAEKLGLRIYWRKTIRASKPKDLSRKLKETAGKSTII